MDDLASAIDRLRTCGVELHEDFDLDALCDEWTAEELLSDPLLLLCALGEEGRAVNLFHLDTEFIEGDGSYAIIARRLSDMARGDLPLEAIEDHVDIDGGIATLSFRLDGRRYQWTCAVDNDWIDPDVLTKLVALLNARGGARRFTYIDTGGQDCVLGCFSDDERTRLASETGLVVDWLR